MCFPQQKNIRLTIGICTPSVGIITTIRTTNTPLKRLLLRSEICHRAVIGGTFISLPAAFGGISAASNITGEVSDDLGQFTNATSFSVNWNATAKAFEGYLPSTLISGTQYRVRLKDSQGTAASQPNGTDITISEAPQFSTQAGGPLMFCSGDSVLLSVNSLGGSQTYQWYNGTTAVPGATTADFTAKSAGIYKVQVVNSANGCSLDSKEWTVQVSSSARSIR
jgi:hypothetical protein